MKVAIVLVTYNASPFIEDCFQSLSRIDRGEHEVSVIVVENASTDDTSEKLAKYPGIVVFKNTKNFGFAGGNNIGMRVAMENGADFIYLLNQDTEVTPEFLVEAVRIASTDEKIGAVQSLLLLSPEKEKINSTGNAVHFLGLGYCMNYGRRLVDWHGQDGQEIAYASGAGVLYRTSALQKVGLFDDIFFMYHEDLDLGWRLRLAGWRNVLAKHSIVYHKYEFSRSVSKFYFMERNRYLVLLKNFRLWTLFLLFPFLVFSECGLFCAALQSGWWKEKLQMYRYFLSKEAWVYLQKKRFETQQMRKVGDKEIVRLFTSVILFQDVSGPFTQYAANPLMTFVWMILRIFIV